MTDACYRSHVLGYGYFSTERHLIDLGYHCRTHYVRHSDLRVIWVARGSGVRHEFIARAIEIDAQQVITARLVAGDVLVFRPVTPPTDTEDFARNLLPSAKKDPA